MPKGQGKVPLQSEEGDRRKIPVSCAEVEKRNTGAKISLCVRMGRHNKGVFYQNRSSNTNQTHIFHLLLHEK